MALSHRNGILLSGISAINGVSSISAINGIAVTLSGSDATPPLQDGAWTIGTDGDTHTLAFSENVVIGAGGSGGFTANMSGGAVTLTYVSGTGTASLVFTGSRTVGDDETQTGSNGAYTQPGNGIEDAAGNDLATFTGHTITNNSTVDQTAPTLSTATVATNGTTLTLVFSEAVTRGAGYADADLDVDASTTGANLGLTYVSGDGTDTFVYTIGSTIQSGETVDLDFNGDANSLEDGAGNDLAAIVSGAVTNNSTQGGPTFITTQDFEGTGATGTGWAGSGDWDYTTVILAGTQSGHITAFEDFTYTHTGNLATLSGRILVQPNTARAGASYFARIMDVSSVVLGEIQWGTSDLVTIKHGTVNANTTNTMAEDTLYTVFFTFTPGTGSDGTMQAWFGAGDLSTKPGGAGATVSLTNGTATASVRKFQLRTASTEYIYDDVQLSESAFG